MSLVHCTARDLMGQITQRRLTAEGFLIAPGTIARANNVQRYTASELGLDVTKGMGSDQIVRLYRPSTEVFSAETLKSFEGQTLTVGHPFGGVDAGTWKDVAAGDVRGVHVDGEGIGSELIVRDARAIKDIQSGKQELSCGYTFDCDLTPGVTADGQAYDGTMKTIRGNHVAIVDLARGGPGCRVADANNKRSDAMAIRKIVVDGFSIELDETQASIVEKVVGDAKKATDKAIGERDQSLERAKADAAALVEAKNAGAKAADEAKKAAAEAAKALDEAKAKIPTPAQIEALASDRAAVVQDAAGVLPEIKCEGKSVPAIRTEVLAAVLAGDSALKAVATAVLGKSAADLSKVDEHVAKSAFDAVVAVKATTGDATANDADNAEAVLGDEAKGGKRTASTKLRGEDVLRARMRGEYRDDEANA